MALMPQPQTRDPRMREAQRRQMMAAQMMQQGAQTTPVASPVEGLARMLQGGIGGWMAGRAERDIQGRDEDLRQQAMQMLSGAMSPGEGMDRQQALSEALLSGALSGNEYAREAAPVLGTLLEQEARGAERREDRGWREAQAEAQRDFLRQQAADQMDFRRDLASTQAAQQQQLLGMKLAGQQPRMSEREQKIADIMQTHGVDRQTASNIANNVESVVTDPVLGRTSIVNRITGEQRQLRAATPRGMEVADATPQMPPRAGTGMGAGGDPAARQRPWAFDDVDRATGPLSFLSGLWNSTVANFAPSALTDEGTAVAQQNLRTLSQGLIAALAISSRPPIIEQQRIEKMIPSAGAFFENPREAELSLAQLHGILGDQIASDQEALRRDTEPQDPGDQLDPKERSELRARVRQVGDIMNLMGTPPPELQEAVRAARQRRQSPRVGEGVPPPAPDEDGWSMQRID